MVYVLHPVDSLYWFLIILQDIESTASIPTLANNPHFDAV